MTLFKLFNPGKRDKKTTNATLLIDADSIDYRNVDDIMTHFNEIVKDGKVLDKNVYGVVTSQEWTDTAAINSLNIMSHYMTARKSTPCINLIMDAIEMANKPDYEVNTIVIASNNLAVATLAARLNEHDIKTIVISRYYNEEFIKNATQFIKLGVNYNTTDVDILDDTGYEKPRFERSRFDKPAYKQDGYKLFNKPYTKPYNPDYKPRNRYEQNEQIEQSEKHSEQYVCNIIKSIIGDAKTEDGWVFLSYIGNQLKKRINFNYRDYNSDSLLSFVEKLDAFDIDRRKATEYITHPYIRIKPE